MPDINPPAAVVVFSRRGTEQYSPPGSAAIYTLAPLTYRERQAMRADMTRAGYHYPSPGQVLAALRAAIREVAPDNAADLLALVDAHEATPDDADVNARLLALEMTMAGVPVYAELAAMRAAYLSMVPWYAFRHGVRGWSGEGMPDYRREREAIPADLMDELPPDDIADVGWRADSLSAPSPAAVGNSAAPSPSPASQTPSTAG